MTTRMLARRWARFTTAGLGGFVVQVAILAILLQVAHVHYLAATLIAVEAAILCNFAWHERWTWSDRPSGSWAERWRRLGRFHLLTGVTSMVGTSAVTAGLVEGAGLSPLVANAIAVVAIGLINFIGSESLVFRAAMIAVVLSAGRAEAATLQSKTLDEFSRYAAAVEARTSRELDGGGAFLSIDHLPARDVIDARAGLRRGDVLIVKGSTPDGTGEEVAVDGGLIHHWLGIVFVPHVALDDVLRTLKEPGRDRHVQEDVVSSRVVSREGDTLKLFLRIKRTQIVTVVYDTEHDVRYRMVAPGRAASSSVATRIVEVQNAGTPSEVALPEGRDHGFLWRLNSYWRYQQTADGVFIELESLTLSRDIPWGLGPIVRPLVDRVGRESLQRTLESMRRRLTQPGARP